MTEGILRRQQVGDDEPTERTGRPRKFPNEEQVVQQFGVGRHQLARLEAGTDAANRITAASASPLPPSAP